MKKKQIKNRKTASKTRKTINRACCIILCLVIMVSLTGCWNYRSLNDISIVVGIAVDKNTINDSYILTFEIIDLIESSKETGVKSKVISSTGETIFDAIRNAKRKLSNKLYFGYAYVLIICQEIAKDGDIYCVFDFFMRDAEPRATINVAISKEETAQELLTTDGVDSSLVAFNINYVIQEDSKVTCSTLEVPFYKAYKAVTVKRPLALPALRISEEIEDEKAVESDGIAIFNDNKLVSFMSAEETKYFMYAIDEIEGGLIEFSSFNKKIDRITFEVFSNKTDIKHSYKDNRLKFTISPYVKVSIGEMMKKTAVILSDQDFEDIEQRAKDMLAERMKSTIDRIRYQIGADILGLEEYVYRNDPKLWKQIQDNIDQLIKSAEIIIEPKFHIINTGFTKDF